MFVIFILKLSNVNLSNQQNGFDLSLLKLLESLWVRCYFSNTAEAYLVSKLLLILNENV